MRGCLFVLVMAAAVAALVVVVGLPALAAGALTAGAGAAGLSAADTTITVTADPPTDLVGLHADRVRVRATNATFRGLEIGALDVTLTDVALVDRTAGAVSGRLEDVTVSNIGGHPLRLGSIALSGGGTAVIATTTIPGDGVQALIADAVESGLGSRPTRISLAAPDRLTVQVGVPVEGRLAATAAGDLVLTVLDGPAAGRDVVLLRGGEDLPIRITSVTVIGDGSLRLVGELVAGLLG
jgi:hypothetical protein